MSQGKDEYHQAQSPGVRKAPVWCISPCSQQALEYAQGTVELSREEFSAGSAQDHELLFQQSMTRKGRVRPDPNPGENAGRYRRPKTEAMVKKSPEARRLRGSNRCKTLVVRVATRLWGDRMLPTS